MLRDSYDGAPRRLWVPKTQSRFNRLIRRRRSGFRHSRRLGWGRLMCYRRVLVGLQRRLIYFSAPAQVPGAEAVVAGAREVTLRTVDGLALSAWLVEAGEPDRGVAVLVQMETPATGRCERRWHAP